MCELAHSSLVEAMQQNGTGNSLHVSLPKWMGDHDVPQNEVNSDPGGVHKCYKIACDASSDFGKFIMPWLESEYFTRDYFYALLLDLSECVRISRQVWCTSHLGVYDLACSIAGAYVICDGSIRGDMH